VDFTLVAGGHFAGSATLREPQHADSFLRSRGPRRYEFGCAGWTILLRQRAFAKGIVRVDLAKTPSPLLRRKDMGARVPRITREHRPIQSRWFAFYYTAVVKCSRCQSRTRQFGFRGWLLNPRRISRIRRQPKIFCQEKSEFNYVGTHGRGSVTDTLRFGAATVNDRCWKPRGGR